LAVFGSLKIKKTKQAVAGKIIYQPPKTLRHRSDLTNNISTHTSILLLLPPPQKVFFRDPDLTYSSPTNTSYSEQGALLIKQSSAKDIVSTKSH